jgi:Restriction Enzyme Adenine Methylase Associated
MQSPSLETRLLLTVKDLIEAGLITAPTRVFGIHSAKRIEATLAADGTFSYRGNGYNSPSVAAGRAITTETAISTPGRNYLSINGWKFWQVTYPDGKPRTLAEIRDQMPLRPPTKRG